MKQSYFIVDVFADQPFAGAQVAVLPHAEGLSPETMAKIAAELNLSETVFIVGAQTNSYRLRVFSPRKEVDLGSHTTLAAARVLAELNLAQTFERHTPIVFENSGGSRDVFIGGADGNPNFVQFSQRTMPRVENYVPPLSEWGDILNLPGRSLDVKEWRPLLVGSQGLYLIVPVLGFNAVREACFNRQAWDQSSAPSTTAQNIVLFCSGGQAPAVDFHLRMLGSTIAEQDDPPVGAAVPAFVAYLAAHTHVKKGTHSFILERGLAQRRRSLLHVEMDHRGTDTLTVRVGGHSVITGEGSLLLP